MSWQVSPVWDSQGFLDLGGYFLSCFREIFNYNLLKYFLMPFHLFFFWDPYDANVGALNIVPEISEIFPITFYFYCVRFSYFHRSIFQAHLSVLLPQSVFCWFPTVYF